MSDLKNPDQEFQQFAKLIRERAVHTADEIVAAGLTVLNGWGRVDAAKLSEADRGKYASCVCAILAGTVATMPVVQNIVQAVNQVDQNRAYQAVVIAIAILFRCDPQTIIDALLGPSTPDVDALVARLLERIVN